LLKRPSRAPLRIAVPPIEVVPADDEPLALAGSGVLTAALSGLTVLEGIAPIDPREASRGGPSPVRMARATAADEVLTSEIRREGALARVTLRRLQGADGRVLWTKTFPVPVDGGGVLADAVELKIRDAYPDHHLRPGVPKLTVEDQDYAAFLEINQRIDTGAVSLEPELARLEAIVRTSPRFLEAQLLAARLALNLFKARRDIVFLERASELVQQAQEISPGDPRPLRQELEIALAANRIQEAEEILGRLERLLSGDPELLVLRARLADRQGHIDEAAELQTAAVEQAPSWRSFFWLADLEARRGHVAEARRWIEKILRQDPGNLWAKEQLGQIEILYGDLARAERIYAECIPANPRRALNNVGMARFLRGSFAEASVAYRRALAIEPDSIVTLIGLADANLELGRTAEAEPLYRRALALLDENERAVQLSPGDAMLKALCLARLGRSREAVELAQTQLRRNPEDPNLLRLSALVHSLAGERASALNDALAALDKGLQPRFFSGSAFRRLRESPEFRSRLAPPSLP
jgi:tetratricopeptide (TPR) repeat protein